MISALRIFTALAIYIASTFSLALIMPERSSCTYARELTDAARRVIVTGMHADKVFVECVRR